MLFEYFPVKMPADTIHNMFFLAKLIEDDFFGKFMVSDTSLRYNHGLDNLCLRKQVLFKAYVCISSTDKSGQLHVCSYYVLVNKAQV